MAALPVLIRKEAVAFRPRTSNSGSNITRNLKICKPTANVAKTYFENAVMAVLLTLFITVPLILAAWITGS